MDGPRPISNRYPILEFDATREAVMEPKRIVKAMDMPEHCVVCFFPDVFIKLHREGKTRVIPGPWRGRRQPILELDVDGKRLAVLHPWAGAPLAAALLEEVIALGCKKFIACGSAGVLDGSIAAGRIIVPNAAVRDEGTSYHYLPPSREVQASPEGVAAIEKVFKEHHCHYIIAKTWTTDALYRETPAKIRLRRSEGCLTVEMEAAAFFAVALFRGVVFAQILYGADDVSGSDWDPRHHHVNTTLHENLFRLAAEACLAL